MQINVRLREVRIGGRRVELARKEWEMLCVLAVDPWRVFTREELQETIWGAVVRGRSLDSHAYRLRQKLNTGEEKFLHNCWGVGYRLMDVPRELTGPQRRFVITDRSEFVVIAATPEEAQAIYLDKGGEFVQVLDLEVEGADS